MSDYIAGDRVSVLVSWKWSGRPAERRRGTVARVQGRRVWVELDGETDAEEYDLLLIRPLSVIERIGELDEPGKT